MAKADFAPRMRAVARSDGNGAWSKAGEEFLALMRKLRVDASGGQRKPHKPLLMLLALRRLCEDGDLVVPFAEVEEPMSRLLEVYAPPATNPEPRLPYWHLQSDGVWEIPGADALPRGSNGKPSLLAMRTTCAQIPERYRNALLASPTLARACVAALLDEHFEPSLHEDVLQDLGYPEGWLSSQFAPQLIVREKGGLARDASFRERVLRAYDHRCVVTGFQATFGGAFFGIEAAHVHWHSKGGPSTVDNGIPLSPTMHKLFDHGAWSLTDDRRIVVSERFSGSDEAIAMLRPLQGKPIRAPKSARDALRVDFIRWHREPKLGGVFRWPAIA